MVELAAPTLEDLREAPEAAWLWDGARARIVWANRPGLAFFGAESLFDLIDLPETGMVDWDALGFGCREPFYTSTLKARRKPKTGEKKRLARTAA